MKRLVLAALPAALVLVSPSHAAAPPGSHLDATVTPGNIAYGEHVRVGGRLTISGAGQPGVRIRLVAQRFPYRRASRTVATARTSLTGRFSFRVAFDRNTRMRVVSDSGVHTNVRELPVVPRQRLSDRLAHSSRAVRVTLYARSPRDVRLGGRAIFYLGSFHARQLRRVGRPLMHRLRAGLWRATARFGIPARWRGGYHVGTCYIAPKRSGMYEHGVGCPHRFTSASASGARAGASAYSP